MSRFLRQQGRQPRASSAAAAQVQTPPGAPVSVQGGRLGGPSAAISPLPNVPRSLRVFLSPCILGRSPSTFCIKSGILSVAPTHLNFTVSRMLRT